jgi:hypothetical protein
MFIDQQTRKNLFSSEGARCGSIVYSSIETFRSFGAPRDGQTVTVYKHPAPAELIPHLLLDDYTLSLSIANRPLKPAEQI